MTGPRRHLFSRSLLLGVLILLLLTTACNLPAQTPAPVGTVLPTGQAASGALPTVTVENIARTAVIPVTGADEVTLQCQFCVSDQPHAVIILSEVASYYTSDTTDRITCLTTQVTNGRRILLCRGSQQASFNLNVCYENANCLQFPVTLDPCLLNTKPGIAISPTPFVLTPMNTILAPPAIASTSTTVAVPTATLLAPAATQTAVAPPLPTQTVFAPPPAAATTAAPASHASPTRAAPQQPATGLQDPGEFVRWYFGAVWQARNYEDLWNNYLTPSFKSRISSGGYDEYVQWWSSVDRVDVISVQVLENDGAHAWVHVNVTFIMKDGRVISNQEYDYDLLFDPARQTWMFDYNT
jgi:hypothetical protein